jgi:Cu/Zn superoxide dismutase
MPNTDFTAAVSGTEVVVKDSADGHIFHFPILGNGTVSMHGMHIDPNPDARRKAQGATVSIGCPYCSPSGIRTDSSLTGN